MPGTMVVSHVHEALRQVRAIQRRVLEAERFVGYSGRTRALGGTLALVAAAVMNSDRYPQTVDAHLKGWLVVLAIAVVGNYSALLYWFLFNPKVGRDIRRLMPTVDALPPLAVGGVLSLVFIRAGLFDQLFGVWMCLYGLANFSSRRVLPPAVWGLGSYYVGLGVLFLFHPSVRFLSPLPMGLVFFLGEWVGGFIFHYCRKPDAPLSSFFTLAREAEWRPQELGVDDAGKDAADPSD